MTKKRKMIAVAWMDPNGPESHYQHKLYRIFEVSDPGFAVKSYEYSIVQGDEANQKAWMWLRLSGAKVLGAPKGIYYAGHPGLVWCLDLETFQAAIRYFAGQWATLIRYEEVVPAPVRFKYGEKTGGYMHMRTTRSRSEMWRLRSKYPSGGELAWIPLGVLIRQFGYRSETGRQITQPEPRAEGVPAVG